MMGRFIFIGYDYFLGVAKVLCEEGWHLTDVFPTDNSEIHADGQALKRFAEEVGAACHGPVLRDMHLAVVEASNVDLVIVAGYPEKIAEKFLSKANFINIHPSYLPIGRGPWPQPHIILNDGLGAGVTFHSMSSEFDEGPIICQGTVNFEPSETIDTLAFKQQLAAEIMEIVVVYGCVTNGRFWNTEHWQSTPPTAQLARHTFKDRGRSWLANEFGFWYDDHHGPEHFLHEILGNWNANRSMYFSCRHSFYRCRSQQICRVLDWYVQIWRDDLCLFRNSICDIFDRYIAAKRSA